jgi:outer membrane protein assembly factor BamA
MIKKLLLPVLLLSCLPAFSISPRLVLPDTLIHKKRSVNLSTDCVPKDFFDLFKRSSDTVVKPPKKVNIVVLPYIGYNPVTGIQFGAGGTLSWHMGRHNTTSLSAVKIDLQYTTKNQLIMQLKSNLFLADNSWYLKGDWRYYIFNIPTYGLGTAPGFNVPYVPGLDVSAEANAYLNNRYPLKYKWLRIHEMVSHGFLGNMYAGLGYHLDMYHDIHDQALRLDTIPQIITPFYAYNYSHGLPNSQSIASGLSINYVFDTRDNQINAYKGVYLNVELTHNFKFLGSDCEGTQLWTEFRTYIRLSRMIPRHVLAFWFFGNYTITGNIPYLNLMSTGFDQMNSSGRGYIQGRWRGEDFIYGEMEYRFPISLCSQIVGGVIFINMTTASNRENHIPLFGYLQPAGGFGVRIALDKHSRTNLLIDFAIGSKSHGMYLTAGEAF